MRIVVEVSEQDFEAAAEGGLLVGRVEAVEVRQEGGLLSGDSRALLVESLYTKGAHEHGLADGDGPAIRIFTDARKEP